MSFKTKAISNTVNFKIGQEFEEKNPGGKVVKVTTCYNNTIFYHYNFSQAVATFEENSLVIVSQTEKGEIRRTLQFTETGINMVRLFLVQLFFISFLQTMLLVSQNVSAKRTFKRS